MKLFGITGGIAMGKSTAGDLLRQRAIPVVDTDTIARQVVAPGQPALEQIRQRFGPAVLGPDGQIDRVQLARQVFSHPADRADLEAILHPPIRKVWTEEAARWRAAGHPVGVVIIPLLFETQAESLFDCVICLACGAATQAERLRQRGWPPEQIAQRLEAQWPIERKIAHARFVVWTDTTVPVHAAQLARIFKSATPGELSPS